MKLDGIPHGEDWLCIACLGFVCVAFSPCHCNAVGRQICAKVCNVWTEGNFQCP